MQILGLVRKWSISNNLSNNINNSSSNNNNFQTPTDDLFISSQKKIPGVIQTSLLEELVMLLYVPLEEIWSSLKILLTRGIYLSSYLLSYIFILVNLTISLSLIFINNKRN
jgi:hypothetical protein